MLTFSLNFAFAKEKSLKASSFAENALRDPIILVPVLPGKSPVYAVGFGEVSVDF